MKKLFFCGWIILFLFSCKKDKVYEPSFPETPVNLTTFNSEFDDYNSDMPTVGETFPLCFSSTRNSKGLNYDIVYKLLTISFSTSSGKLDVFENLASNTDVYMVNENINHAISKINTTSNEFGPYLINKGQNSNGSNSLKRFEMYVFLYSNNSSGNQDIKFTHNLNNEFYEQPMDVRFLNSEFDDAYPTFNKDFSGIYFTSNRENNFDIYRAEVDKNKDLIELLSDTLDVPIHKDSILSSPYDDKCPYISGDFMVFTSNRTGGFGGYDLYYSRFENGKWGEPKNFGEKINTSYDEYRPIIRRISFSNDFMLFSSNRPGGKGGFDLYYVGIDEMRIR